MAKKPIQTDWSAIKTLFLSGITLPVLSERFGVKLGTIQSRSSREKWAVPSERVLASIASPTEKTTQIVHDIWADRASSIREKEFRIAEKALTYSEQMPEDQILKQATNIDTLGKMGRRATGLDKEQANPNAINIAILGDASISDSEARFYTKHSTAIETPILADSGLNSDSIE